MISAKRWILTQPFTGTPAPEYFTVEEFQIDPSSLKDGEFVAECQFWSVDPYNQAKMRTAPKGTPVIGGQVAKIIHSKSVKYPVDTAVVGHFGWGSHAVGNESDSMVYAVQCIGENSLASWLSIFGRTGMTAYFGVTDVVKPEKGETLVVNGAAGAVGSLVGQIGVILGLNVIGYAGSDEKVEFLKSIGFSHAFNYKTTDLKETLKTAAPKGVDVFFDNVGGDFASTVYPFLNLDSRICQCGAISTYHLDRPAMIPDFRGMFIGKRVKMIGFLVQKYADRWPEGVRQMTEWLKQGKIQNREDIAEGFENIPTAFLGMMSGKNIGKMLVKA